MENQNSMISNFNDTTNKPKNVTSPLLQNLKQPLKKEVKKVEQHQNTKDKKELLQLEEDLKIIALDEELRSKANPFKKEGLAPIKTKQNPLEKLIMKGSNTVINESNINSLHGQEDKSKKLNK